MGLEGPGLEHLYALHFMNRQAQDPKYRERERETEKLTDRVRANKYIERGRGRKSNIKEMC